MSLKTKVKVTHTLTFPIAMYGCGSQTVKKVDENKIASFEIMCQRRALPLPWITGKTSKRVLEQVKPEMLLQAKMTKLKLSYLRHNVRRRALWKRQ